MGNLLNLGMVSLQQHTQALERMAELERLKPGLYQFDSEWHEMRRVTVAFSQQLNKMFVKKVKPFVPFDEKQALKDYQESLRWERS